MGERVEIKRRSFQFFLQNIFATKLLLRLVHDLQELLNRDTAIARDIGFMDDLVNISLIVIPKKKGGELFNNSCKGRELEGECSGESFFFYLRERAVAKVLKSSTKFSSRHIASAILVDRMVETSVSSIGGLSTVEVLGHQGREGLVVQRLGGDLDLLGQLGIVEELL